MSGEKKPPRKPLPNGTGIDCYRITKLIGSGGFSLIYLARDEDTEDEVVIKEYLPKKMATRPEDTRTVRVLGESKTTTFNHGKKLFYQEARALAKLKHNHIVNVHNFFLDNGTAYLVMDYERGKNLGGYIKRRGGNLSTRFLLTVFPPLLDALTMIHNSSLLHLDIKPSNIHLRPGGSPLLLDFGAVHRFDENGDSGKTSQVVTPGFSPLEQYYSKGKVGTYSDVYAIGASMRACIEGKSPPTSVERHAKDTMIPAAELFHKRYPAYLLEAIDWAMQIKPENRPQTSVDLLKALIQGNNADSVPIRHSKLN